MRSNIGKPFIIGLAAILLLFAVVRSTLGTQGQTNFVKFLFALTVVIEIIALTQAIVARKVFVQSDSGHLTWTLIVAFLVVRLIAELRLVTLTFGIVEMPKPIENASSLLFFYAIVLRYIYTVSDVLFIAALITTVRAYKSSGLKFEILKRDYAYLLLVWAIPVLTYVFRANLGLTGLTGPDKYIPTYRLVAVFVGAIIISLCIWVRRYAVQMGGGAVAKVWNTVVVAGIARGASFLTLALLSQLWDLGARFFEQYLLVIFAGCWLLAALYQQEVLLRLSRTAAAARDDEPVHQTA